MPILIKSEDYKNWKQALVIMCSANLDSPLSTKQLISTGKICVRVQSVNGLKVSKPAVSMVKPHIFVKLSTLPFSFQTSIMPQNDVIVWDQRFILPIFNRFFALKIEVCVFYSEGWLKQQAKEEVIKELTIPLTDINQEPYITGPIKIPLKLNEIKKKLVTGAFKGNEDKLEDAHIVIEITDWSSFQSMFVPPPSNYIESEEKPVDASMKQLKLISKRFRRMRILYLRFLKNINSVFQWRYPKFTKYCIVLYILIGIFLPEEFVISLLLSLILLLILVCHPDFEKYGGAYIKQRFFQKEQHMEPYPRVKTIKENLQDLKSQLSILKEKNQLQDEGMLDKWKKFKKDMIELQNGLLKISTFLEKIRSLVKWEDPKKSLYFVIGLAVLIVCLSAVPPRIIILAGGLWKFYKGKKTAERRVANNKRVCDEVLTNLFNQFTRDLFLKTNSYDPWPMELVENSNLQKKIVDGIRTRLSLNVDISIFKESKSPAELLDYIRSTNVPLKMKGNKGEKIVDKNKKRKTNPLVGFLSNIPSEYYRYQNPRLF
jgi:hypothetical protein